MRSATSAVLEALPAFFIPTVWMHAHQPVAVLECGTFARVGFAP